MLTEQKRSEPDIQNLARDAKEIINQLLYERYAGEFWTTCKELGLFAIEAEADQNRCVSENDRRVLERRILAERAKEFYPLAPARHANIVRGQIEDGFGAAYVDAFLLALQKQGLTLSRRRIKPSRQNNLMLSRYGEDG